MPKLKMIATLSSDEVQGRERRWVDWKLPDYRYSGVTSVNTIFDLLKIFPKDGECFLLSVEQAAEVAEGE